VATKARCGNVLAQGVAPDRIIFANTSSAPKRWILPQSEINFVTSTTSRSCKIAKYAPGCRVWRG